MEATADFVARLSHGGGLRARTRDDPLHGYRRIDRGRGTRRRLGPGGNCCSGITRLFAGSSRGTRGESSTPPVTASSLPSTGRLAPSAGRHRDPRCRSRHSGSRSAPASTRANARRIDGKVPESPSPPAPASHRSPAQVKYLSQAQSRTSSPARASRSRIEATTSSRASPTPGASSPSLPDDRDLARLGQRSRMSPEGEQADRLDLANDFRPAEPDGV